jgi:hypothetical protein
MRAVCSLGVLAMALQAGVWVSAARTARARHQLSSESSLKDQQYRARLSKLG